MMKKLLFLAIAVLLVSCNGNQGFTIKLDMPANAGSELVLKFIDADGEIRIDSVTLDDQGMGKMSGTIESPEMMSIVDEFNSSFVSLFMDNFGYEVSGTMEDATVIADGGPQVDFTNYNEATKEYKEKMEAIGKVYSEANEAGAEKDSLQKIIDSYYAIADEKNKFDSVYSTENPSSVVGLYLLRGSYYRLSAEELEAALAVYDESLHTTSYYTFMSDHLTRMKNVMVGMDYVDFELPDSLGNPVKLSDLAGKGVLLIDFWASWCGPCRRANPGVVEVYQQYKDQGFDILGVSLDDNREKWLQAVKDDKLTWTHISDVKGWNCDAAKLYAVSGIPHTVLLDKNGKIVAKNLHKEELKAKIEELLAE